MYAIHEHENLLNWLNFTDHEYCHAFISTQVNMRRFGKTIKRKALALFYHWSTRRVANENAMKEWNEMNERKKQKTTKHNNSDTAEHQQKRERARPPRTSRSKRVQSILAAFYSWNTCRFVHAYFCCENINWMVRLFFLQHTHRLEHGIEPLSWCIDGVYCVRVDSYLIYVY